MDMFVEDYYTVLDGKRTYRLDGRLLSDFVPVNDQLKGDRKSPAIEYLIGQGFEWEDAQDYLDGLPELKDGKFIVHEID
jgi:hypothetical protein